MISRPASRNVAESSCHWNAVLTRQVNVQSKGPLIAKFARAMVEAIHSYKRDKESTLKIISKYTDYMPTSRPEAAKADPNEFVSELRFFR